MPGSDTPAEFVLRKPFRAMPSRQSKRPRPSGEVLFHPTVFLYARHLHYLGRDRSRKVRALIDAAISQESNEVKPVYCERPFDSWGLGLSGVMTGALLALAQHGKLYRWATSYGAAPTGLQFREQTILALVERGFAAMKTPQRDYRSHYAALTAVGRLVVRQLRVGKKAAGRLLDGREWNEFSIIKEERT